MSKEVTIIIITTLLAIYGNVVSAEYDELCDKSAGIHQVSHPHNCSQFINCNKGIGTVNNCPSGKWFDVTRKICWTERVALCNANNTGIPQYVVDICGGTKEVGVNIPGIECEKYYVCYGSQILALTCKNGWHYSRAYRACMNPLVAGCRVLQTMCDNKKQGFSFPALNCESYYTCNASGQPEMMKCSRGQYYNGNLQKCTAPAVSNCTNDGDSSDDRKTTATATTTATTTKTTMTTPLPAPNCAGKPDGSFLPHAKCNWLYVCYEKKAHEVECGIGQYYNTKLQYCDEDLKGICKN